MAVDRQYAWHFILFNHPIDSFGARLDIAECAANSCLPRIHSSRNSRYDLFRMVANIWSLARVFADIGYELSNLMVLEKGLAKRVQSLPTSRVCHFSNNDLYRNFDGHLQLHCALSCVSIGLRRVGKEVRSSGTLAYRLNDYINFCWIMGLIPDHKSRELSKSNYVFPSSTFFNLGVISITKTK